MRRTVLLGLSFALAAAVAGPAAADSGGPATPQRVYVSNGATSITLSWTEPATGARPAYFQVYENGAVVARNTTTDVTISNLVWDSTHTYTVTAVDASGHESAPSAAVSRTAEEGGPFACGFTTPSSVTLSGLTASGVSVSWSNEIPYYDEQGTLVVLLDGATATQTNLDSARVSGLAPSSTHTIAVARRDCNGQLHTSSPLTFTTLAGAAGRPSAPTALAVTGTTNSSVALSWTAPTGSDPTADYAVYDGGNQVATTTGISATIAGLWRDTAHQFTVSALDAAGGESAQSAPAATSTLPCDTVTPQPTGLTVTPRSASTVALAWSTTVESAGFVVYRTGVQAATVAGPSAVVTGLPSASTAGYSVAVVELSDQGTCGTSAQSAPVTATTLAGPAARPAAPTGLAVTSTDPSGSQTGTVSLSWSQPASADPVAGYRLYEGSTALASTTSTSVTLTLPAGPTHSVNVVSVDAAGEESALDGPVQFQVPFIPFP